MYLIILSALVAISTGACTHSAITSDAAEPAIPETWQRGGQAGVVDINWLANFENPRITALVHEAVENNYTLAQERARLYQAEQTVVITRANRFPDLNLSFNASRRGLASATSNFANSQSISLSADTRWEVDMWGRLSKQQQAAQLQYSAQQARLELVERNIAAQTTASFFDVMEARQLLEVAKRRLDNTSQSREIVASGYRQGLNDALDLYLARNQVERQEANYAQQEQLLRESIADLQLSLARYPDGRMEIQSELPVIADPIPVGLPSELIMRRADVQESWLNLLAADAQLAANHKARFPSLTLVAGANLTSISFANLFDGDTTGWSIAGGLTQPLFNAGRLEALEEQAFAQVQLAEQQYLDLVFRAFADVENSISRAESLQERYTSFLEAEKNSSTALALALEQYQRGLVTYTTVLESQRQAFDAEATVVQLRNQLLQNRITLYQALGGDFSTE